MFCINCASGKVTKPLATTAKMASCSRIKEGNLRHENPDYWQPFAVRLDVSSSPTASSQRHDDGPPNPLGI